MKTTNQQRKAMTTKEAVETFASFEQTKEYSLAYIHIFNVARAYAKKEKKHIFQCSKKSKQDMALNSVEQLVTIIPTEPMDNIASAKTLDYIINFLEAHDERVVLLPEIVDMMIDELIIYFNEMHKATNEEQYSSYKESAETQKWMWEGMKELRHATITPTVDGFKVV
ncbi:hypothetical protein [Bacillus mycoides]|uniref:hypothetical protein n=1 Tax=Bacillus mycoides TaxID=1405 RepID=UPI00032D7609|nr:hypothetical protein [Bacillus mycoides]EOO35078.1 hypothetical protein IKK_05149 [Bacillus mycoides]